jgi:sugar/nucleoside kinase (ribokinase family)
VETQGFDCVVCGSCVVDMLIHPVPLHQPVGAGKLLPVEPIQITTGGIVCNAGIGLARLGLRVAAFSYTGDDEWAAVIHRKLDAEQVNTDWLLTHPHAATSTTAVMIDPCGERSFAHSVGAPKLLDKDHFLKHLPLFARSRFMLIGYYSLMPRLESELPTVLAEIRAAGCRTALDAAGAGGAMQPLDRILPELDVYVPSQAEAAHQTGLSDPRAMIDAFRACGAPGIVGVKLGSQGALLSEAVGHYLELPAIQPPGPVVDTTGAGDAYYAGLIAGLLKGLPLQQAGRLAAAAGACCVTGYGATAGLRGWVQTADLAWGHPA